VDGEGLNSENILDKSLYVRIKDEEGFISQNGEELIVNVLESTIGEEVILFKDHQMLIAGAIKKITIVTIGVSIVLSLFTGGSSPLFWIFLGSTQLLAHLPILAKQYPRSLRIFMASVLDPLNFKFFELESVWGVSRSKTLFGYTDSFVFSTGLSFQIFFWAAIVFTVFFYLNKFVLSKMPGVKKVSNYICTLFVFGFFIRYLLHVYICFTLSAFMNVENMHWNSGPESFSSLLALVFCFLNASIPFILAWVFSKLQNADLYYLSLEKRVNTIVKGIHFTGCYQNTCACYNVVFLF
jgi:hypothetical protein